MPRVQEPAPQLLHTSVQVPLCSLGHPFSSFQLFIFVLYPAMFLLTPVLERVAALALVNWDLETVTTGRWDAFSH